MGELIPYEVFLQRKAAKKEKQEERKRINDQIDHVLALIGYDRDDK